MQYRSLISNIVNIYQLMLFTSHYFVLPTPHIMNISCSNFKKLITLQKYICINKINTHTSSIIIAMYVEKTPQLHSYISMIAMILKCLSTWTCKTIAGWSVL